MQYEKMNELQTMLEERDIEIGAYTLMDIARECFNYDGVLEDYNYYPMDEIEELLYGNSVIEIINMTNNCDFNINDDYFKFTIYGLESANDGEIETELLNNSMEILECLIDYWDEINGEEIISNSCYADELMEIINNFI